MFERLEREGINVPWHDRYYRYVSAYDYEANQIPDNEIVNGQEMRYLHIPGTFPVCSNILGHTWPAHKSSNGSSQELVRIQLQHQEAASELTRTKFEWVFEELEQKISNLGKLTSEGVKFRKMKTLKASLEDYCDKLPVLGLTVNIMIYLLSSCTYLQH